MADIFDYTSFLLPEDAFDDDVDDGEEGVDELIEELTSETTPIAQAAGRHKIQLELPSWHARHDQGKTKYCVGYSGSMMQSIKNNYQSGRNNIQYNSDDIGKRTYRRGVGNNKAYNSLTTELQRGLQQNTYGEGWTGIRSRYGIKRSSVWKIPSSGNINGVRSKVRTWLAHKQPVPMAFNVPVEMPYASWGNRKYKEGTFKSGGRTYVKGLHYSKNRTSGAHSVCIYGHDPYDDSFLIKNSWGGWGREGCARWPLSDLFGPYGYNATRLNLMFMFSIDRLTY